MPVKLMIFINNKLKYFLLLIMPETLRIPESKINWDTINTTFVDSIQYYDTKKDLNLIKFKTEPKTKSLSKPKSNSKSKKTNSNLNLNLNSNSKSNSKSKSKSKSRSL